MSRLRLHDDARGEPKSCRPHTIREKGEKKRETERASERERKRKEKEKKKKKLRKLAFLKFTLFNIGRTSLRVGGERR